VSVIELKSGNEISHIQGRMDSFLNLTWSPDGKKIAIISTRITGSGVEIRSVKTYTVKKGLNHNYYAMGNSDTWYTDEVNISSDKVNSPVKVIWNPTATMLAVAFHDKFDIYDVNANNKLFSEPSTDLKTINWSPDGKVIITQNGDNTISLWGVTSDS
jgi:WD40 repeat protein